jgi:hypothetical protein
MGAAADGAAAQSSEWRFEVGTYIWAPAIKGDVTVDSERIPIDADVADIVRDADSLFALNLFFFAKKGRWGLLVRPQFMKLGADSGEPLQVKVVARAVIGEASGTYTFLEKAFRRAFRNVVVLDAIFGARVWWLGVQVKAVDGFVQGEGNQVWVDPLAGLLLRLELLDGHLPVLLRGDVGGWGVGSRVAWAAEASAGYRWFRKRLDIALALSFRAIAPDYLTPSGSFGFDSTLYGPAVAVDFGF